MKEESVLGEKEVKELLKEVSGSEKLEKESAISWDGRNLIIRIPKEIADYFKINENNRFENNFKFIIEDKNGIITKSFDFVNRTKPIKEKKKNAVSTKQKTKKNNKS